MRPEILKITEKQVVTKPSTRCPYSRTFWAYEVECMDELLREVNEQGRNAQVGSIVEWSSSQIIPSDVFRLFDWVICASIPSTYWDDGGIVRPAKWPFLPNVWSKRSVTTFMAGFEKDPVKPKPAVVPRTLIKTRPDTPVPALLIDLPIPPTELPKSVSTTVPISPKPIPTGSTFDLWDDTPRSLLFSPLPTPLSQPPSPLDDDHDLDNDYVPSFVPLLPPSPLSEPSSPTYVPSRSPTTDLPIFPSMIRMWPATTPITDCAKDDEAAVMTRKQLEDALDEIDVAIEEIAKTFEIEHMPEGFLY